MISHITEEITQAEYDLICRIRNLRPFERVEIKLDDNKMGKIAYTITSNVRITMEI